jgi:hypothetical protein
MAISLRKIQLVSKLNPVITNGTRPKENQVLTYFFDIEKCKVCPLNEGCNKKGAN